MSFSMCSRWSKRNTQRRKLIGATQNLLIIKTSQILSKRFPYPFSCSLIAIHSFRQLSKVILINCIEHPKTRKMPMCMNTNSIEGMSAQLKITQGELALMWHSAMQECSANTTWLPWRPKIYCVQNKKYKFILIFCYHL